VATTCLAETIGDDVPLLLTRYRTRTGSALPLVHAATPSYKDGHVEGFHAMVYALVKGLACNRGEPSRAVNLLPPLVSPADLRHLREIVAGFEVAATVLPDYADRLDGVILDQYRALPDGGTRVVDIASMPRALGSIDLTLTGRAPRASKLLVDRGAPAPCSAQPERATVPCQRPWLPCPLARWTRFSTTPTSSPSEPLANATSRICSWAAARVTGWRTRSASRCCASDFQYTIAWALAAFCMWATGGQRGFLMSW
jgi:hypothetical protein